MKKILSLVVCALWLPVVASLVLGAGGCAGSPDEATIKASGTTKTPPTGDTSGPTAGAGEKEEVITPTGETTTGGATTGGTTSGGGSGETTTGGTGTPPTACGDGSLDPGEGCDDGNVAGSDGCAADCTVETGYTCTGVPSACAAIPPPEKTYCNRYAFVSDRVGSAAENLFLANDCAGGAAPLQITKNAKESFIWKFQGGPTFNHDGTKIASDFFGMVMLLIIPVPLGGTTGIYDIVASPPALSYSLDLDANDDGSGDYIPRYLKWSQNGNKFAFLAGQIPVCGNNIREGYEQCDDGNTTSGDGCSDLCTKENAPSDEEPSKNQFFVKQIRMGTNPENIGPANSRILVPNNAQGTLDFNEVTWSKDGHLVFSRKDGDEKYDLYATDPSQDLGLTVKIEGINFDGTDETDPSFAVGSDKLLFVRDGDIWSCDFKVSATTVDFTMPTGFSQSCSSVMGTQVCFPSGVTTSTTSIPVKTYRCEHQTQITDRSGEAKDAHPCYSYDGKYIFFASNKPHGSGGAEKDWEIWRINADGSGEYNLTNNTADEDEVACSPVHGPEGKPAIAYQFYISPTKMYHYMPVTPTGP
ncbi:MAG TPA: DUF4215 domain-containing protein [bacterium]|nr:DUF4215 domain-containing protein [bacterium]